MKGNWDAIVDEETWRGVRDMLANPVRRTGASRARKHLLSNLAKCAESEVTVRCLGWGRASTRAAG